MSLQFELPVTLADGGAMSTKTLRSTGHPHTPYVDGALRLPLFRCFWGAALAVFSGLSNFVLRGALYLGCLAIAVFGDSGGHLPGTYFVLTLAMPRLFCSVALHTIQPYSKMLEVSPISDAVSPERRGRNTISGVEFGFSLGLSSRLHKGTCALTPVSHAKMSMRASGRRSRSCS